MLSIPLSKSPNYYLWQQPVPLAQLVRADGS